MKCTIAISIACLALLSPCVLAKKTRSQRSMAMTPEEQLKTFKLPEGYIIELVASERDGLINPIDMASTMRDASGPKPLKCIHSIPARTSAGASCSN